MVVGVDGNFELRNGTVEYINEQEEQDSDGNGIKEGPEPWSGCLHTAE